MLDLAKVWVEESQPLLALISDGVPRLRVSKSSSRSWSGFLIASATASNHSFWAYGGWRRNLSSKVD